MLFNHSDIVNSQTVCLCGSGLGYASCCGQYHTGKTLPVTAEALMRSRYSAYALKNAAYLVQTWAAEKRPKVLDFSEEVVVWQRLEIINTKKGGRKDVNGVVEFKAFYVLDGVPRVMAEVSRFCKVKGRWYYVDGVVSETNL